MDVHDWRGFWLAVGLMALLPLLVIIIGNLQGGRRKVAEGFAAYALAQKTPSALLFSLMGVMVCGGVWAVVMLIPTNDAEQNADDQLPDRFEANVERALQHQP